MPARCSPDSATQIKVTSRLPERQPCQDGSRKGPDTALPLTSVADGVEQVGRVGRLDDAGLLEFDHLVAEVVEQPFAGAE
jgi:hypothetical protein